MLKIIEPDDKLISLTGLEFSGRVALAAPELLKACKAALTVLRDYQQEETQIKDYLFSVIAKAEGR